MRFCFSPIAQFRQSKQTRPSIRDFDLQLVFLKHLARANTKLRFIRHIKTPATGYIFRSSAKLQPLEPRRKTPSQPMGFEKEKDSERIGDTQEHTTAGGVSDFTAGSCAPRRKPDLLSCRLRPLTSEACNPFSRSRVQFVLSSSFDRVSRLMHSLFTIDDYRCDTPRCPRKGCLSLPSPANRGLSTRIGCRWLSVRNPFLFPDAAKLICVPLY
jgi:hypothetical protein